MKIYKYIVHKLILHIIIRLYFCSNNHILYGVYTLMIIKYLILIFFLKIWYSIKNLYDGRVKRSDELPVKKDWIKNGGPFVPHFPTAHLSIILPLLIP